MPNAHREVPADIHDDPLAVNWDEYIPVDDPHADTFADTMADAEAEQRVDGVSLAREEQILRVLDSGKGEETVPVHVSKVRHPGRIATMAVHPSAPKTADKGLDKAA